MVLLNFRFPKADRRRRSATPVASGTREAFGYVSAARVENGEVIPSRTELVRFGDPTNEDEIDLGSGAFLLAPALAQSLRGEHSAPPTEEPETPDGPPVDDAHAPGATDEASVYRFTAEANGEQLFRILPAIQNLSDRSSHLTARIDIEAESDKAFDRSWLRTRLKNNLTKRAWTGHDTPDHLPPARAGQLRSLFEAPGASSLLVASATTRPGSTAGARRANGSTSAVGGRYSALGAAVGADERCGFAGAS